MKTYLIAILSLAVSACATVTPINQVQQDQGGGACRITVYQTKSQAEKVGPIDELCIITGTSAFSFSHTVQTAIDKHKHEACGCGAQAVYISDRRESGLEVATVTMVGFRFRPK